MILVAVGEPTTCTHCNTTISPGVQVWRNSPGTYTCQACREEGEDR